MLMFFAGSPNVQCSLHPKAHNDSSSCLWAEGGLKFDSPSPLIRGSHGP